MAKRGERVIHLLRIASRGEGGLLIYYEVLRKNRGEGFYIVSLRNAREFSGQSFSAMNKRVFNWSKLSLSLSLWQMLSREFLFKKAHALSSKRPDLSITIHLFEGAW